MQTSDNRYDETALARLASELDVSRSTVSKVLRHCFGVNTETRQRVLRAAKGINELRPTGTCSVYCIIPDMPSFFWQEMWRGIGDAITRHGPGAESVVKCNAYSRLYDEETVLSYLDEAEYMDARCVIIAAAATDAVKKRVSALCADTSRFVILLSEYADIQNAFYVGADSYGDGRRMAEHAMKYMRNLTYRPDIFMLSLGSNFNISERINGFRDALSGYSPVTLPLDPERMYSPKTLPSYLASLMTDVVPGDRESLLYVPMGLPALSLALKKSGLGDKVRCFCHDIRPEQGQWTPDGTIAYRCTQDIYNQGFTAVDLAFGYLKNRVYPDNKRVIVESVFS